MRGCGGTEGRQRGWLLLINSLSSVLAPRRHCPCRGLGWGVTMSSMKIPGPVNVEPRDLGGRSESDCTSVGIGRGRPECEHQNRSWERAPGLTVLWGREGQRDYSGQREERRRREKERRKREAKNNDKYNDRTGYSEGEVDIREASFCLLPLRYSSSSVLGRREDS